MDEYRFVMILHGEILKFDSAFQKEVFYRYLEINGLDENVVLDANQDWEAVLEGLSDEECIKEMPSALPDKYNGDIFDELNKLYIDFESLGISCDLEIIFEDIVGMSAFYMEDREVPFETIRVLSELGYNIESFEVEGETWGVVR